MNKIFAALSLSALVGLTSGCATSYHRFGLTGGYSDTQLAPDVFRVHFQGNGLTSQERAQDFVLLRAAEISLAKGFPYFALLGDSSSSNQISVPMPGSAYTSIVGSSAFTTFSPGIPLVITKPHTEVLVQGFTTKPADRYTFDVAFLQDTLKRKYSVR